MSPQVHGQKLHWEHVLLAKIIVKSAQIVKIALNARITIIYWMINAMKTAQLDIIIIKIYKYVQFAHSNCKECVDS